MPPLICPSPVILDQSFPRDEDELARVVDAFGNLQLCIEENQAHLLLTETLMEIVGNIEWQQSGRQRTLHEIYRFFQLLFLRKHERLIHIDVSGVDEYQTHPVPQSCENRGLEMLWSDEMGKILSLHDRCCNRDIFFVGIACEFAFSGEEPGTYHNPDNSRALPLVGPDNLDTLDDAYDWDTPYDIHRKQVSFDAARKHCTVVGATGIEPPSSGSHYKVKFKGQRSWTLDPNTDPIPERFLNQLRPITGYPIEVIKTALIYGKLPGRVLKFDKL